MSHNTCELETFKPCPFCGMEGEELAIETTGHSIGDIVSTKYRLTCSGGHTTKWHSSREEAIADWHDRIRPEPIEQARAVSALLKQKLLHALRIVTDEYGSTISRSSITPESIQQIERLWYVVEWVVKGNINDLREIEKAIGPVSREMPF